MKIRIPHTIFYQALFVLCIAAPYFNSFEITFAIWSFTAAVTVSRAYSFELLKQVGCFVAILAIAVAVMLNYKYESYFIIRDFTYLIKPVLGLLIGYQICKRVHTGIFKMIVVTGLIIALLHLWRLFYATFFHHAATVNAIRLYAGYFSDFEVYALVLLVFYRRFGIDFSKRTVILLGGIIGFSVLMYMARTNFIQFIILIMAIKGYFAVNKRSVIIVSSILITGMIGYSAILYVNPKRTSKGLEALMYKIKIAPTEPFKMRINRENWKELNDNYRSYENILTVRQVSGAGTEAVLFGKGLGSKVNLKQKMWLDNNYLQHISILHNGYMTVFLKSGLVGVAFFVISIFLLFKKKKTGIPIVRNINLLMVGSAIFMIISAWVFMGFYLVADTKSIIIGMLICSRELYLRQGEAMNNKL